MKPKRGNTILAGVSTGTEADAEKALASLPRARIHLQGSLQEPMWPTLAAFEVAELTGIEPDDLKWLADQGCMPTACYIREGERFAFRATAVAWAWAYIFQSHLTGLATVTVDGQEVPLLVTVVVDGRAVPMARITDDDTAIRIDMAARPAQAEETWACLARLSPELLHSGFLIEILEPGRHARSKKLSQWEFAPAMAQAAKVWWEWLAAKAREDGSTIDEGIFPPKS